MHLIGAELRCREQFVLVYSAVTRRTQPIAKVANIVVKISQIIEANDYGLVGVGAYAFEGNKYFWVVIQDTQLTCL